MNGKAITHPARELFKQQPGQYVFTYSFNKRSPLKNSETDFGHHSILLSLVHILTAYCVPNLFIHLTHIS